MTFKGQALGSTLFEIPFTAQLPFLAEGIIAVQYYENQVLDGKGGLYAKGRYDMSKINRNVIAGHYVKDFLYHYIEERIFPDDCTAYRLTMKKVTRIFQMADLGQAFQGKWGTYAMINNIPKDLFITSEADDIIDEKIIDSYWRIIQSEGLSIDKEVFVRHHLRRIYLTSGVLFRLFSELIMDLLGYYGKERPAILQFATQLGLTGQIVNDINDFVPAECGLQSVSKTPNDAFADIRNDNITLPLLFYFDKNVNCNIHRLQKANLTSRLHQIMEGIQAAQNIAMQSVNLSKNLINTDFFAGFLLLDMNSIVCYKTNRFYNALLQYVNKHKSFHGASCMKMTLRIKRANKLQRQKHKLPIYSSESEYQHAAKTGLSPSTCSRPNTPYTQYTTTMLL